MEIKHLLSCLLVSTYLFSLLSACTAMRLVQKSYLNQSYMIRSTAQLQIDRLERRFYFHPEVSAISQNEMMVK